MQIRKYQLTDLAKLIVGIARDRLWDPHFGPRMVDDLEAAVSVLIAIACAHALQEKNIGWAAFSAYMVMRSHAATTLRRGLLRIVGTVAGATAACIVPSQILSSPAWLALALALVGTTTLYLAVTERYGYAWLFIGLTFCMLMTDELQNPSANLYLFAESRIAEVATGTFCAILVSAITTMIVRRRLSGDFLQPSEQTTANHLRRWQTPALLHALKGGVALAIIPLVWPVIKIPSPVQASITILAVLMIPVASLASKGNPVTTKLLHRFVGCIAGGILAAVGLFACHQSPVAMAFLVAIGVILGRHIENSGTRLVYIGTQFTLAFLVVLVPDTYQSVNVGVGIDRFLGILCGMGLLYPILLIAHFMHRGRNKMV